MWEQMDLFKQLCPKESEQIAECLNSISLILDDSIGLIKTVLN